MVTTYVEEEFVNLLNEYIDAETKIEITRQVLVERKDFDAYSCYRRIITPELSGITRTSMKQFLRDNGMNVPESEMDLLFWKLDVDGDGYVNWHEFLDLIQSRELSRTNSQYDLYVEQTIDLEHSLARIFEQEMMNQRNIENARRRLHLSSLTETKLFDTIDRDRKGYITPTDLETWLTIRNASKSYTRYERAFRRMDLNNDGRITFEEFLQMVRPIYNYSSGSSFKLDTIHYSPAKSLVHKLNDIKEEQIAQKLEEINLLRQEINESKIGEEKEVTAYTTPRESQRSMPIAPTLINSIYADKYMSPARRLVAEVREEVLLRSMDGSRMRSLYESPVKASDTLTSTRLKLELEETRRWWRDRYSSPVRYNRYYSPLKTNLELERVREQRERQKLRESITVNRHSLAREALKKDIEEKRSEMRIKSMLDSKEDTYEQKQLSPANKSRMVVNLRDSIWDNKMVEDKRIDLSLRYDFSLYELFSMMDYSNNGYVSLADFERFVYDYNILQNRADLCIILDKYDIDKDNLLSFAEFCEIFLPKQPEFKVSMENRVQRKIGSFFEYSSQTKEYIKDLFKMIVNVQERFEEIKFRLSDGRILNSDEIFKFLDKWKTGYVTLIEFNQALKEAGIVCSDKDVKSLFDQFDRNKDGRITFDEFHSPMRSRFFY